MLQDHNTMAMFGQPSLQWPLEEVVRLRLSGMYQNNFSGGWSLSLWQIPLSIPRSLLIFCGSLLGWLFPGLLELPGICPYSLWASMILFSGKNPYFLFFSFFVLNSMNLVTTRIDEKWTKKWSIQLVFLLYSNTRKTWMKIQDLVIRKET